MKKALILCSIFIALMLAACGDANDYYEEQDDPTQYVPQEVVELDEPDEPTEPEEPTEPTEPNEPNEPDITEETAERVLDFVPSIDLDFAAEIFAIAQALWDEDDGQLMGVPLHAPLMIADNRTRHAVTNMPDAHGRFIRHGDVYVGIVPDHITVVGNPETVSGTRWGAAAIRLYTSGDIDKTEFIGLLIHEGFHAIQYYIISGQRAIQNFSHFNEPEMRISALLEIEALFAALRSNNDERLTHIHNALSLRNARRYGLPESAVTSENQQELTEGLAMLAELMLAFADIEAALERMESLWTSHRVGRALNTMSGYHRGFMYAMLLNEMGADWIAGIDFDADLGQLLQEHLGINELRTLEQQDLEQYGYSAIVQIERVSVE